MKQLKNLVDGSHFSLNCTSVLKNVQTEPKTNNNKPLSSFTMLKSLRIFIVAAFMMLAGTSFASHLAAGNMSYTLVGPNQYLIKLTLYRDCSGITMPTSVTVQATSSCGNLSLTMPLTPGSGGQIPPSPCASGGQCYEEYIYQGTVTLPTACADWSFNWSTCCRNSGNQNLSNSGGANFLINAGLNNIAGPNSSSPAFNFIPIQLFCVNNEYFFDMGATDPNNDSLVYSLGSALGTPAPGVALPYQAPYSANCPIPTTPACGLTIDPNTGIIHFTPSMTGFYTIVIKIDEYDRVTGLKIGSVMRDVQINIVTNCNPVIPVYAPSIANTGILLACDDTTFIVALGVNIQCGSVVPDGSDFRMFGPTSNLQPNPVIQATPLNCVNGRTDSVLLRVFTPLVKGTYYLYTKLGNDNNTLLSECGTFMPEFDTVLVIVDDTATLAPVTMNLPCNATNVTLNFADLMLCSTIDATSSDFILVDQAGTPFASSTIQSIGCSPSSPYSSQIDITFNSSISSVTTLYLLAQNGTDGNTVSNRCGNFSIVGDTLATINVSGTFAVSIGSDQNVCSNQPLPWLLSGISNSNYIWTLNGDTVGTNQDLQTTLGGTYAVYVYDGPTCSGTDTMNFSITPAPQVDLGTDQVYCAGDPIQTLDATFQGALSYNWTLNGAFLSNNPTVVPAASGVYLVTVNVGAQCLGTDSVTINILNALLVTTAGDAVICEDDMSSITATSNFPDPNNTYTWTLDGSAFPQNTATITTNEPGIYEVTVTSSSGCSGTETFQVLVEKIPVAPVVTCASVLDGTYTYTWTSVSGSGGYEVSLDGGNTWITPSTGINGTSHQTTTQTSNFVVHTLSGGVCRSSDASALAACEIFIPNIITPDGDGKNDTFVIKNLLQYPNSKLFIYNRWGTEVYNHNNYEAFNNWDGSGLSAGTYFYILYLPDGTKFNNTLTIVR